MNILIITQYFWPEGFRINDIACGLTERGHTITVLTGYPNYPSGNIFEGYHLFRKQTEIWNNVKIVRAPIIPRGNSNAIRLCLNYLSYAVSASIYGLIFCRGKYDSILVFQPSPVTCGIPARIIKSITEASILFWVQDIWPQSLAAVDAVRSGFLLKIVDKMVRWIYRGCDRILIQSRSFADTIINQGVHAESICYLPNSAEPFYVPVSPESVSDISKEMPDGFRVMFAGNIGAAQDFQTILASAELLKNYKDIKWIIAGDGRLRKWVEDEIQKRNLSDQFFLLGQKPAKTMPGYFAYSDILLVTLKNEPIFALTIPSKVQSYLACAKPVLAALAGEGATVVKESGGGLTCPPETPQALADKILEFYNMPAEQRQLMGNLGREYFLKNFDRDVVLDRLENLLLNP